MRSGHWFPEQIAGWLRRRYPDDPTMQLSHEPIYRSLFVQARGVRKKELVRHLRTRRAICSRERTTRTLRRWSSGGHASRSW